MNNLRFVEVDTSQYRFSRYKNLRRVEDEANNLFIETARPIFVKDSDDDIYHEVLSGQEGRLDLLAYDYYGNPLLWWVIAEANDIADPFLIPIGKVLRIPSKMAIFGYEGVLV